MWTSNVNFYRDFSCQMRIYFIAWRNMMEAALNGVPLFSHAHCHRLTYHRFKLWESNWFLYHHRAYLKSGLLKWKLIGVVQKAVYIQLCFELVCNLLWNIIFPTLNYICCFFSPLKVYSALLTYIISLKREPDMT